MEPTTQSPKTPRAPLDYEAPYPTWMLVGIDVLAVGMLVASFRDAWSVVRGLGGDNASWLNGVVAGAVVLAIDAAILMLEQIRGQVKLRGGRTWPSDVWVTVLIALSATLNVRYLSQTGLPIDRGIGVLLGIAIPTTIAVLGFVKGDMLAHNAKYRRSRADGDEGNEWTHAQESFRASNAPAAAEAAAPLFRLKR